MGRFEKNWPLIGFSIFDAIWMAVRGERAPWPPMFALSFLFPTIIACVCYLFYISKNWVWYVSTIKKCFLNVQLLFYQVSIKNKIVNIFTEDKFKIKTVGFWNLIWINFEQKLIARQKMPACERYNAYSANLNYFKGISVKCFLKLWYEIFKKTE